jgi:hypothetical protein
MGLLQALVWLGQSPVGAYMQRSTYAFEVAEMVHLLGLAGLGGGILIIDLCVLGFGIRNKPAAGLVRELTPYLVGCLSTSVASGVLLLAAEPLKCYYNAAFRVKMILLIAAVLFSMFVQRPLLQWRITAAMSLLIWLGVGVAGRAIGVI